VQVTDIRREGNVLAARVSWEEGPRPPIAIRFEAAGEGRGPDANPYLAACILPAMHHGERRLAIEGEICPRLAAGAAVAVEVLRAWHGPVKLPVSIEAGAGFRMPFPRRPSRAALLFTGGINSTDVLLRNRKDFPPEHPAAIRSLVHVVGLEVGAPPGDPGPRIGRVRRIAEAAGVELRVVATNILDLERDLGFVSRQFLGAALASAAHALASDFDSVAIGSGWDVSHGVRCGSHAFVDPQYSSGAVEIRHEGSASRRLDKVARVARWEPALRNLAVCTDPAPPEPWGNCGRCEKCLRTRLELVAAGAPDAAPFPPPAISAGALEPLHLAFNHDYFWEPLVAPLRARGRGDLADAVADKVAEARRHQRWFDERGWKGALRAADRRLLGGLLARLRRPRPVHSA
jgi:hypothetical protein